MGCHLMHCPRITLLRAFLQIMLCIFRIAYMSKGKLFILLKRKGEKLKSIHHFGGQLFIHVYSFLPSGDRYLKPWIIPEPEIMFVPRAREDECLVLASDGLWDVMSNEEACEVARRRILLWHKKNGTNPLPERGQGVDPAAQAAAEYLSSMALQKGSKDNISVIVVDLKSQRKFKSKC